MSDMLQPIINQRLKHSSNCCHTFGRKGPAYVANASYNTIIDWPLPNPHTVTGFCRTLLMLPGSSVLSLKPRRMIAQITANLGGAASAAV